MKPFNSSDKLFNFFNVENLNITKEVPEAVTEIDYSKINYLLIKKFYRQHKELILDYRNDPDSYSEEAKKFLDLFSLNTSKNRKESEERAYVLLDPYQVRMYFSILCIMYIDNVISYDDFIEEFDLHSDSNSLVFLIEHECYEDIVNFSHSFIPNVIKRYWNIIDFNIHDKYILIDYIDLIKEMFVENFIPLGSTYLNNRVVYGLKEKHLYNSK